MGDLTRRLARIRSPIDFTIAPAELEVYRSTTLPGGRSGAECESPVPGAADMEEEMTMK